jgi:H+-translocating NAD(P) transhydrogenase subunit alpha
MDESFYERQRVMLADVIARSDVVITTAMVPGQRAPLLVSKEAVVRMGSGSVIVDLAAPQGGNCELTQPARTVVEHGVTIAGPTNLPATVPFHASQMYAKNAANFLLHIFEAGHPRIDLDDEITNATLVIHDGQVLHPRVSDRKGQ